MPPSVPPEASTDPAARAGFDAAPSAASQHAKPHGDGRGPRGPWGVLCSALAAAKRALLLASMPGASHKTSPLQDAGTALCRAFLAVAGFSTGALEVDDSEMLWVVDGAAYDLTDFVRHHPGGEKFLLRSRGRDITVTFNTYHPNPDRVRPVLAKYRVRDARPGDVNKSMCDLPAFLIGEDFDAARDLPRYAEQSGHLLPALRALMSTREMREKIRAADRSFDVVSAGIFGLYVALQAAFLAGSLGMAPFVAAMVLTRIALAGAGHYFLHRSAAWPWGILGFAFDVNYVGFALVSTDGHVMLHHAFTMAPGDVKRGIFDAIKSLPRLYRLPVHTAHKLAQTVTGVFIRGSIVQMIETAKGRMPRDGHLIFAVFCLVRLALVAELVTFCVLGHFRVWFLQFFFTLWISTFQVVASHDLDAPCPQPDPSNDWAAFQVAHSYDMIFTGWKWADCFLTAGLGPHRVHHVLPYQRSGFANIISEPALRRLCEQRGMAWAAPLSFWKQRFPVLVKRYLLAPAHSGAVRGLRGVLREHLSLEALRGCARHVYLGVLGEGSF